MKNKLFRCILVIAMCFALIKDCSLSVNAIEVPDLDRKGSITVRMLYKNKPVSGGTLTLYRVARVDDTDYDYTFQLTGDFVDYPGELTDFENIETIRSMEKYIKDNRISGTKEKIDKKGYAVFEDLEIGLYFVVQTNAAPGYNPARSFFVSLPVKGEDGIYCYDIDASPKTSLSKKPKETPPPPLIPDTGVEQWKVPAFAICGVFVFSAGWVLFRKGTIND